MLLKNFTNLIHIFTSGGNSSDGLRPNFKYDDGTSGDAVARYNVSDQNITILPKGDSGYTTNNQLGVYYLNGNTGSCNNQFRCVTLLVGTGTTPVTFDDYALTRETTLTTVGVQNPYVDKDGKFTISHTLQNNTSADITITELGLARAGVKSGTAATATNYILLTRDVLDNPVTIPVGESRIFSIVIDQWNFSTGYNQSATVLVPKTITQNGVYNPADDNADGYSSVTVNVSGGAPQNIPLEINDGILGKPQASFSYTMPSSVTDIGDFALQMAFKTSGLTSFSFSSNLTDISGSEACSEMCNQNFNLQTINWGGLTTVSGWRTCVSAFGEIGVTSINVPIEDVSGEEACLSMFGYCPDLQSATLSLVNVSGNSGCSFMFDSCPELATVDISSLETVTGNNGLQGMFEGCESLTTLTFTALEELATGALTGLCSGCISLTTLSFPALTTLADDTVFNGMLVDCDGVTVHFPAALQATIGNWQSVIDGFGGTNTTVLFDL